MDRCVFQPLGTEKPPYVTLLKNSSLFFYSGVEMHDTIRRTNRTQSQSDHASISTYTLARIAVVTHSRGKNLCFICFFLQWPLLL